MVSTIRAGESSSEEVAYKGEEGYFLGPFKSPLQEVRSYLRRHVVHSADFIATREMRTPETLPKGMIAFFRNQVVSVKPAGPCLPGSASVSLQSGLGQGSHLLSFESQSGGPLSPT